MNDLPPTQEISADKAETTATETTPKRGGAIGRVFGLLVLLGLLSGMGCFAAMVAPGPLSEGKTVVVPHGTNMRGIADMLKTNGAIYDAFLFRVAAKAIAYNMLKAGEYQFTPGQSMADIILQMHEGRSVVHKFTVAEGLTSAEIVRLLKDSSVMTGDVTAVPPDGSLLPETYNYSYGDSRAGMIARMQKDMQSLLNDVWARRDPAVPLATARDAVVMASVIEKETGKATERPRIAGVFYNRLRQHMRLQSDPTVIYGIVQAKGFLDHDLDHNDLAFISPYNTYLNDGLPPAPICNPGRASLEAALHPEGNDYLYFVADGSGGHVFSHDLAEHNQNVLRWNQVKAAKP